jgi:hypothetical protein
MGKLGCITMVSVFALLAALAIAQDKPNFTGSWQLDPAKCEQHTVKVADATWAIEESDNSIHLTETESGRAVEMKCSTDGKDCDVHGDKAKASFWFNGPMLVEMETKGDHVTRYRLTLSQDGKTLKVETTYIVPRGDANDVLVFTKKS